nr:MULTISPECIES: YcgJ family protein [Acinetobacter]
MSCMLTVLAGCQSFSNSTSSLSLENPERNVLCDQYICANSQGVSKELTAKYLGDTQANKIFSQGKFDTTQFTFSNGIFCDTKEQRCHTDRYFNQDGSRSVNAAEYTKALFAQ